MSEDRLILAIGRMERALARVEGAAVGRQAAMADTSAADQAAYRSLEERHARLKARVESAITALDGIIAKG